LSADGAVAASQRRVFIDIEPPHMSTGPFCIDRHRSTVPNSTD